MRIGIIGCGFIGEKRALSVKDHEIVVLNDINRDRAEALSKKVGGMAVANWREVISANVDVVMIATSHESLAEIAMAALKADRHVLLEKPGARNAEELKPLLDVARSRRRVVKIGFNHRFHPTLLKAKALVDSGEVGDLLYIRGRYGHGGRKGMEREWRCQPARSGGGELIDQGPHLVDLSRWFLGGDLKLEYGAAPTLYWDIPVDDNCFMALRSPRGQFAWLHATWVEWKNMFSFEIIGREGKLVVEGLGGSYGLERLTFYKMHPQMGPPETTIWEFPFPDTSWEREFLDFSEAMATGRRPCGDLEDAMAVLEIVAQVYARSSP